MKTALLISGQPRFSHDFTLQLNNLRASEPIDLWCRFWLPELLNEDHDRRAQQWIPKSWPYDPDSAAQWIRARLPPHVKLGHVSFIDPREYPLGAEYRPWYCNGPAFWRQYQCLQSLAKILPADYDLIIRSRPDLAVHTGIDLDSAWEWLKDNPQQLIIPDDGRAGPYHVQDQWALGLQATMLKYLNVVDLFDASQAAGQVWNPEHVVGWAWAQQGISWPKSNIRCSLRWSKIDAETPYWGVWE